MCLLISSVFVPGLVPGFTENKAQAPFLMVHISLVRMAIVSQQIVKCSLT